MQTEENEPYDSDERAGEMRTSLSGQTFTQTSEESINITIASV
jgi:hypothetical protein